MKIESKKSRILQDFATKLLKTIHLKNKFKKINNIEKEYDNIFSNNKSDFLAKYNSFRDKLFDNIKNKNYDELMKLVPGKMILFDVAQIVGFVNDLLYVETLLLQINGNIPLKKEIKNFIEID